MVVAATVRPLKGKRYLEIALLSICKSAKGKGLARRLVHEGIVLYAKRNEYHEIVAHLQGTFEWPDINQLLCVIAERIWLHMNVYGLTFFFGWKMISCACQHWTAKHCAILARNELRAQFKCVAWIVQQCNHTHAVSVACVTSTHTHLPIFWPNSCLLAKTFLTKTFGRNISDQNIWHPQHGSTPLWMFDAAIVPTFIGCKCTLISFSLSNWILYATYVHQSMGAHSSVLFFWSPARTMWEGELNFPAQPSRHHIFRPRLAFGRGGVSWSICFGPQAPERFLLAPI